MENISYVGLSQQMALKQWMDVTANNIANMSTPGFKAQNMLFHEYMTAQPAPRNGMTADPLSMVAHAGSYVITEQGPLQQTGNQLDLALQGKNGYFGVITPRGTSYTRAGNFALNNDREIVTQDGIALSSQSGQPIKVPVGATKITVTADGTIATEQGPLGKIKVVSFENPRNLKPVGYGLYDAPEQAEKPPEDVSVVQGMIEGSNVQPVVEMNKMIEISRLYEMTARMLQNDHDRQRTAISKLTRV